MSVIRIPVLLFGLSFLCLTNGRLVRETSFEKEHDPKVSEAISNKDELCPEFASEDSWNSGLDSDHVLGFNEGSKKISLSHNVPLKGSEVEAFKSLHRQSRAPKEDTTLSDVSNVLDMFLAFNSLLERPFKNIPTAFMESINRTKDSMGASLNQTRDAWSASLANTRDSFSDSLANTKNAWETSLNRTRDSFIASFNLTRAAFITLTLPPPTTKPTEFWDGRRVSRSVRSKFSRKFSKIPSETNSSATQENSTKSATISNRLEGLRTLANVRINENVMPKPSRRFGYSRACPWDDFQHDCPLWWSRQKHQCDHDEFCRTMMKHNLAVCCQIHCERRCIIPTTRG